MSTSLDALPNDPSTRNANPYHLHLKVNISYEQRNNNNHAKTHTL
jgi:hypothetical protein